MTDLNLPALREAVARLQSVQFTPEIDPGVRGWIEDGKVVADALPALLDEVEALRVELDIEKKLHARAADDHAALLDELEAARAVLDTVVAPSDLRQNNAEWVTVALNRAAWLAWQER